MDISKLERLRMILQGMGSCLIAYSGGIDSTFLCAVAYEVLGESALALTGRSFTMPHRDLNTAIEMAKVIGIRHIIVDTNEMEDPRFVCNPKDRCFYCKTALFNTCLEIAKQYKINQVIDGFNADDANDFRPGHEAGKRLGVRSPLLEAGIGKKDIRDFSRDIYHLPIWAKPQSPCLASRFPYGMKITTERLRAVEQVEELLHSLGIEEVRCRYHEEIARIEVKEQEMDKVLRHYKIIAETGKKVGFKYVTMDLEPFRSGRLNE